MKPFEFRRYNWDVNKFCISEIKHEYGSHRNLIFSTGPFVCNLCGKVFTELRSLTRHQHTIHEKSSTSFSCTDCDYTTSRKSNLDRHLKRHTNPVLIPNSPPKVA